MANTIKLKRSSTANSVPSAVSLEYGELALNYTDGNLFFKTAGNAVTLIASTQTANYSGNVSVGNLTASGNVSASYILGNGSALSGLSKIENGTSNVNVTSSGGNVTVSVGGTSNVLLVSTSGATANGNINASGNISVTAGGSVRWFDVDGSNWIAFRAPSSVAANVSYQWPGADGAASTVLSTDGSGTLSWVATGGSQGGFFNSTLNAFPGSAGNYDYGNGEAYVGQAATTDPFGVNLINNYDNMDPSGAVLSWDLGLVV